MNAAYRNNPEVSPAGSISSPVTAISIVLFAVGLLARLSPLLPDGRLFWQYMTEDGYLMQTIARNMAIGLGMSTAEGSIETNGVQPLATFMFAGLHLLAGGSKAAGIALVTLFSAAVTVLAAFFLHRIGQHLFARWRNGRETALLVSALWFAAPLIVPTSMNGLETSVYFSAVLGTCLYYLRVTSGDWRLDWQQRLLLGALLGISFLARNDAVFFIASLLLVHLLVGGSTAGGGFLRRLLDCFVAGLTSIAIATPWLVFNYRLFGSIVPISGTAQSHGAALGANLHLVPSKLFEAATLYLPIPAAFEGSRVVAAVCLVVLAAFLVAFWHWQAEINLAARRYFLIGAGMTLALAGYYGLFFGAPHFLTRYFSILSPFLWVAVAATVIMFVAARASSSSAKVVAGAASILAVIAIGFVGASFMRGKTHMHRQVVDWVEANVPRESWVGAVQTGTLGYFHDRTINLDGKVNPAALRELLDRGHILDYVVDSRIDYIVDWADMADWVGRTDLSPAFANEFEVVVDDETLNLAALRRKHPKGG